MLRKGLRAKSVTAIPPDSVQLRTASPAKNRASPAWHGAMPGTPVPEGLGRSHLGAQQGQAAARTFFPVRGGRSKGLLGERCTLSTFWSTLSRFCHISISAGGVAHSSKAARTRTCVHATYVTMQASICFADSCHPPQEICGGGPGGVRERGSRGPPLIQRFWNRFQVSTMNNSKPESSFPPNSRIPDAD